MMLGEVRPDQLVRQDGARLGDRVLLTKGVAIEGTAVLAQEHPQVKNFLEPTELENCERFLKNPGISVVKEARIACQAACIHAMHDPTEGGIATALRELAEASEVGLKIQTEAISVYPETQKICRILQLDPLGLLASGALLLTVDPVKSRQVIRDLEMEGIPVADIGEVTAAQNGILLIRGDTVSPIPVFPQDEVARALA
jgi:hydrogenase maturation factor